MSRLIFGLRRFFKPDISIFHQFVRPPYGGGNQFLLALRGQLENIGYSVETNKISKPSRACLFNSFNFDFNRLRRYRSKRSGCRLIHRVDGPISAYRGRDDDTDHRIHEINRELADATIFQSRYSYEKHLELGMEFVNPSIIMNAANPDIFNPSGRILFNPDRKTKLIASSWSSNLRKGVDVYRYLDSALDFRKFEFTFVGHVEGAFDNIKIIAPVSSERLAEIYKEHDIYITASQDDPCSNALIEAICCGLPAVYRISGGHGEIVKNAGVGFSGADDVIAAIDKVAANYSGYQEKISVNRLSDVATSYLDVMGIDGSDVS